MKRIEFVAASGLPVSFRVQEIATVMARHSPGETTIITNGGDGFAVMGSYAEVIKKIEEAENADI